MPVQFGSYSNMKPRPLGIVLRTSGHSHQTGDSGLSLCIRQVRFANARPKMPCIALVLFPQSEVNRIIHSYYFYKRAFCVLWDGDLGRPFIAKYKALVL